MPDYPEEGALRGGHIPTAVLDPVGQGGRRERPVPQPRRARSSCTASSSPTTRPIVYCRIGERSSHTWFVLTHLLGMPGVRNYDGSWTEWGNTVRVPIVVGEDPGSP